MSHLDKADLCVNHALSVKLGFMLGEEEEDRIVVASKGPSKIFTKFLAYVEPPGPEEKGVESFFAGALRGHACTISSVVNNGKRYVWWMNPWGAHEDWYKWDEIKNDPLPVPPGCNDVWKKVNEAEIEDVKKNADVSDSPLPEHVKIRTLHDRLGSMLGKSRGRGAAEERRADVICHKFNLWAVDGSPLINPPLPEGHVMNTLQLLKLMTDAEHLVVIHPFRSMPGRGPQTDDGIDCDTRSVVGSGGGACVLWSNVYMKRVQRVMGEFLADRKPKRTEAALLELVTNVLTTNNLGGELHATQALANFMDLHGDRLEGWKTILSIVYDIIPEKADQRVTRFSTSTRFNSDWHAEIMWKLRLVMHYIKKQVDKNGTRPATDMDLVPEVIAGYIESIFIVASAEARDQPAYTETVGHIATFVEKNRWNSLQFLNAFVNMLRFLVSCKHNETIPVNNEAERRNFQLPTLTRTGRDRGQTFLKEHAALYGYGALDGSDFSEDTRKRRRRTESMDV